MTSTVIDTRVEDPNGADLDRSMAFYGSDGIYSAVPDGSKVQRSPVV